MNASGSNGNNVLIQHDNINLMIDAGISRKRIIDSYKHLKIPLNNKNYILITHTHTDHILGLAVLYDHLNYTLIATKDTVNGIEKRKDVNNRYKKAVKNAIIIKPNCPISIEGIKITAYSTIHDSKGAVGYIIESALKFGYVTDTAGISKDFQLHLSSMTSIMIESNYDEEMLEKSRRPLFLKRRIRSNHLSNTENLELLEKICGDNTQILITGHLSGECNTPTIVAQGLQSLREKSKNLEWIVATRDSPSPTISFDSTTNTYTFRGGLSSKK